MDDCSLSEFHGRPSELAVWTARAYRFMNSRVFVLVYLGLAVVSLASSIVVLCVSARSWSVLFLEVVLNALFAVDFGVRVAAQGRAFFNKRTSYFETFVGALCIVSMALVLSHKASPSSTRGLATVSLVVLGARNVVQLVRITWILRSAHNYQPLPALRLTEFSLGDADDEFAFDHSRPSANHESMDSELHVLGTAAPVRLL